MSESVVFFQENSLLWEGNVSCFLDTTLYLHHVGIMIVWLIFSKCTHTAPTLKHQLLWDDSERPLLTSDNHIIATNTTNTTTTFIPCVLCTVLLYMCVCVFCVPGQPWQQQHVESAACFCVSCVSSGLCWYSYTCPAHQNQCTCPHRCRRTHVHQQPGHSHQVPWVTVRDKHPLWKNNP